MRPLIVAIVAVLVVAASACVSPTPPDGAPAPRIDMTLSETQPVTGAFSVTAQPVNFSPTSMEFRLDTLGGAPIAVDPASPFQLDLDASTMSIGSHTLWATAADDTYTVKWPLFFRASRPNVIFLMTDDMRADEANLVASLKPDGGFNWMKEHATRFGKMWMTDNLCCPGRTTALTGQTVYNHRVFENYEFPILNETIAKWEQNAGYCTAFAGKYINNFNATSPRPDGWTYWQPLVDRVDSSYDYTELQRDGSIVAPGEYITDHLASVARAQLDDCLAQNKPAFIALWPSAPHFGTEAEPDYANVPVPWTPTDPSFNEADFSDKPQWLQNWHPTPRANGLSYWSAWIQLRVRTLLSVDDALKSLIDDLAARDQLGDTLFILTSDNGYLLGEHRVDNRKRLAYEAAQSELWIAGEGFEAGVDSDAFDMNMDLAPTILRASHATPGLTLDGMALQDLLAEPSRGHDRFLPIYVPVEREGNIQPVGIALRTWHYKYVQYFDGSEELYDLFTDPFELDNAANNPALATVKADMIAFMQTAVACSGDTCRAPAPASLQ